MLTIHYEYHCGFCKAQIYPPEHYEVYQGMPAQNMEIPRPRQLGSVVGSHMACDNCIAAAIEGIKKTGRVK